MSNDNIDVIRQRSAADYRDIHGERDARAATHDVETLLTALDCLQRKLQIRWQDLPGATAELVDSAPEGMRQLMRQWVDEFSQLRQQLAATTTERDRIAASFSPRYDDDRSILSVIAHLRHGDSDGSDHDAAADEIERLAADRDRYRNENFALSQDDGKVERALESKQAECDQLRVLLADTSDRATRAQLACEQNAFAMEAALAEVRGEMPWVASLRDWVNWLNKLHGNDWSHVNISTCDAHTRSEKVLAEIDSLQLQEAASRNGFAQAKVREQGLRERLKILTEDRDSWIAANSPGGWIEDFRNRALAAESRAQELGEAISQAVRLIDEFETRTSTAWPTTVKITKLLQSALAPAPSQPTEHNPLDCEQCWLPHGDPQS